MSSRGCVQCTTTPLYAISWPRYLIRYRAPAWPWQCRRGRMAGTRQQEVGTGCQHRSVTRVPAVLRVPPRRHLRPPAPPPRRPGPARPPAAGPPPGRQVRGEGGLRGPGGQRRGRGGEAGAPGEAAAAQPAHHPRAGLQQPLPGPGRHLAARPAAPRPGAAGEGGAATHRHHPRPLGAAAEGWLPSGGAS